MTGLRNALSVSVGVLSAIGSMRVAPADVRVVSGYDDVLRQSDNRNVARAVVGFFKPDRTFAGMPELMGAITGPEPLVVVSGFPEVFRRKMDRFLDRFFGPSQRRTYLRNPGPFGESTVEFKVRSIREAVGDVRGDPARTRGPVRIFLDDGETSRAVAEGIRSATSARGAVIYFQAISAHPIDPRLGLAYTTAFDVALAEYRAGRLDRAALDRITAAVISAPDGDVVPAYAHCPEDYEPLAFVWNAPLAPPPRGLTAAITSVRLRVRRICSERG